MNEKTRFARCVTHVTGRQGNVILSVTYQKLTPFNQKDNKILDCDWLSAAQFEHYM